MGIRKSDVEDGDVLIGQNLLIIPSLLLENKNKPDNEKIPLDPGHFHDFCTLVSTLTMNERLLTFPANIPDEVKDSQLYTYLTNKKILRELDHLDEELKINHIRRLTEVNDKQLDALLNKTFCFCEYVREDNTLLDEVRRKEVHQQRQQFIYDLITNKVQDTFFAGYEIQEDKTKLINYYQLRTAVYQAASEEYQIPFVPDLIRIPIIVRSNYSMVENTTQYLENRLRSESVIKGLQNLLRKKWAIPITVPPTMSIFLSKYHETSDLESTIDFMRERSLKARKWMVDLQDKIIKEEDPEQAWDEATSQIDSSLNSALELRDQSNRTYLSIIPKAAVLITDMFSLLSGSPSNQDMLSTSAKAIPTISEIIDYLIKYYKATKVSRLLPNKTESVNAKTQSSFLKHAFGEALDRDQIEQFVRVSDSVENVIKANLQNKK